MQHTIASLKDRLAQLVNMWDTVPFATIVEGIRQYGKNEEMAPLVNFSCDKALALYADGVHHLEAFRYAALAYGAGAAGDVECSWPWRELARDCRELADSCA
ncbi:hypothetical protein UFOVP75_26 [uncultured Caudovirales phage]|uniref:Uncharacterized protein n=1 Tax=uncultured Caudovirales phage TaxID=2100421 RepID=A0A6J5KZF8_9CAUD|nr:hypothetical protein UFOVP75_26 [uncultured Caudovirales phage]